jgi:hypothetical protein
MVIVATAKPRINIGHVAVVPAVRLAIIAAPAQPYPVAIVFITEVFLIRPRIIVTTAVVMPRLGVVKLFVRVAVATVPEWRVNVSIARAVIAAAKRIVIVVITPVIIITAVAVIISSSHSINY